MEQPLIPCERLRKAIEAWEQKYNEKHVTIVDEFRGYNPRFVEAMMEALNKKYKEIDEIKLALKNIIEE